MWWNGYEWGDFTYNQHCEIIYTSDMIIPAMEDYWVRGSHKWYMKNCTWISNGLNEMKTMDLQDSMVLFFLAYR